MIQRYVHKGLRLSGGKKIASLQLLDEDGKLTGNGFNVTASYKEAGLLGYIFEADFDWETEKVVGLKRSAFDKVGTWDNQSEVSEWMALQTRALAKSKHVTFKAEQMSDLCNRLHNERIAYQSALDRGDYDSAQAIKDLVLLALDKKLKFDESDKYLK